MKLKYQIGIILGLVVLLTFLFKYSLATFLTNSTATVNFISVFGNWNDYGRGAYRIRPATTGVELILRKNYAAIGIIYSN